MEILSVSEMAYYSTKYCIQHTTWDVPLLDRFLYYVSVVLPIPEMRERNLNPNRLVWHLLT